MKLELFQIDGLAIKSAELKVKNELFGIRYYLSNYKISIGLVFIFSCSVVITFALTFLIFLLNMIFKLTG
jgi:hypothetical protein